MCRVDPRCTASRINRPALVIMWSRVRFRTRLSRPGTKRAPTGGAHHPPGPGAWAETESPGVQPSEGGSVAAVITVVLRVLRGVIAFVGALSGGALLWGRHLRSRGQLPFDAAALAADGGRSTETVGGRVVEYVVYGGTDPRAAVVVNMHGSGFEARFEAELYEPICAELGVRAAGDVDDRRAPQRTVTRTRAGRRGHRSAGQRCPWCRISAPNRTERRGRHGQPVRGSSAQSPSPASPQPVVRLRFRRPGHHARLRIELERAGESPRRVSIRHGIPAASPRFATSALTVGPSAR